MDPEKYWSTTETNKFLYQQLKAMCEANGFVLSPRKGKHFVRIAEHYVQIVWPEISYNRTLIHVSLSSAGSYENDTYADKRFCPHGEKKDDIYSVYYDIAIEDSTSYKEFYDIQRMKTLWTDIIEPQFNREIFSCLDAFSFERFMVISEKRVRYDGFQTWPSPKSDDAIRLLSMGYGELWKENFEKGISLLGQAAKGFKKGIESDIQLNHEVPMADQENFDAVTEVLSMIQGGSAEVQVIEKMQEVERIALNKAWGVALSPEGKTVRLKKKELL